MKFHRIPIRFSDPFKFAVRVFFLFLFFVPVGRQLFRFGKAAGNDLGIRKKKGKTKGQTKRTQ